MSETLGHPDELGGFWVYCHRCWCQTPLGTAVAEMHEGDRVWTCPDCAGDELADRRASLPSDEPESV